MAEQNTPAKNNTAATAASKESTEVAKNDNLHTSHGKTQIEDNVVGKIAGLAAREVTGVHALGGGGARTVGAIREAFGAGENIQQGVDVEVGERQAAVDLSIVAEYGVAIHELAEAIRRNIIKAIERMTGLEVTEVNVNVTNVHLESDDDDEDEDAEKKEKEAARARARAEETSTPRVQ
ncbi:Asp23/Gls24 family envelope stress response protein [Corynebacterium uberis]|uniref:Asp23/Gls24 family envelope stress response protein n=1 Tax=Corynebacterium uberis TaxID=2883169 RepID=UPI001D0A06C3|nr:Asp23/Gls24 family envelope stress response protein [Corynebacterium uberis]UDL72981.1 Asp23/Gls24 family envelope stress response protein [Corynebacterium uberis]UDL82772.1 Asp23/Gls24 family envelope stress response protein [Corynebacterium uberis]